jgi:hypothetical protein
MIQKSSKTKLRVIIFKEYRMSKMWDNKYIKYVKLIVNANKKNEQTLFQVMEIR